MGKKNCGSSRMKAKKSRSCPSKPTCAMMSRISPWMRATSSMRSSSIDVSSRGHLAFVAKHQDRSALYLFDPVDERVLGRWQFEGLVALLSPSFDPAGEAVVEVVIPKLWKKKRKMIKPKKKKMERTVIW